MAISLLPTRLQMSKISSLFSHDRALNLHALLAEAATTPSITLSISSPSIMAPLVPGAGYLGEP